MANKEAKREKLYSVKDIITIAGLNRNQIYYWSKTTEVIPAAQEVPGRQLFLIRAVIDFCLIAELQRQGMSPSRIQSVFEVRRYGKDVDGISFEEYESPWDVFLKNRWKYEKGGFFLVSKESETPKGSFIHYYVGTGDEVEDIVLRENERFILNMSSALVVNLLKIIHAVEEKAGEELE